eukprot:TRINITY_DN18991_c1_g1_i2.p1 TRINITY_DN18991_c1_g1~~TRINITY_DN18991_c1_g1_i2.p1  ORF type:complete len:910 (+),score=147.28 TRINITY_DN18991_c1_g1_i2:140-2869(+)
MQCVTLGDLLTVLRDLLPHEVQLCADLLEALKNSDALACQQLSPDAVEVCRKKGAVPREKFAQQVETDMVTMPGLAPPGAVEIEEIVETKPRRLIQFETPEKIYYDYNPAPTAPTMVPPLPGKCQQAIFVPSHGGSCSGPFASLEETFTDLPEVTTSEDDEVKKPRLSMRSHGSVKSNGSVKRANIPWANMPWLPSKSYGGVCERLFILFDDGSASVVGRVINIVLAVAIGVSTVAFILESMPAYRERPEACLRERTVENCEPRPMAVFNDIETVCIAIFTIDYVVRLATIHAIRTKVRSRFLRTILYARQPLNVIDLIAIAPYYVNLIVRAGPMRMLRLARILRLFKAGKHHRGMMMLAEVMVMSGQPLMILMFFNGILTVMFAALIYFAEGLEFSVDPKFTSPSEVNGSAPFPYGVYVRPTADLAADEVSPFRSIPYAVWWVLTTMTTVGYGDMAPTSPVGKVIGVAAFYVGIVFLALPISVLGTNFEIVYNRLLVEDTLKKKANPPAPQPPAQVGFQKKKSRSRLNPEQAIPWIPQCQGYRRKLFVLLEDPTSTIGGKWLSIFIISVILVSTGSFIMESMPQFRHMSEDCTLESLSVEKCEPRPDKIFKTIEALCITIFTIDYILRLSTVHAATGEDLGIAGPGPADELVLQMDEDEEASQVARGSLCWTLWYACQGLNLIDFLAIVPFYVELAGGGGGGASVLRVLRLVRIFRVMKVPKMRACADMFIAVVMDALPALLLLLFMTMLMCVLYASLVVFAEGSTYSIDHFVEDYPHGLYIRPTKDGYGKEPTPYHSIVYAFWWFFTTATTVGYGDDYPTTTFGRCVGVMTFYTGIVLISLPITVVGGSFNKHYPDFMEEFGGAPDGFRKAGSRGSDDILEVDRSPPRSIGDRSSCTRTTPAPHIRR